MFGGSVEIGFKDLIIIFIGAEKYGSLECQLEKISLIQLLDLEYLD